MNDKLARIGRPARRGLLAVSVAGLVVAVSAGSGIAQNDGGDGRDPDAVPGAVSDASAPAATTDGRPDGAAPDASVASRPAASQAPAVLDTGRGGADPAVGPNPIVADAARPTVARTTGPDTDSGIAPVPDAEVGAASGPSAPEDEDVPGSAGVATADDASRASGGATQSDPVVDRDEP